MPPRSGAEPKSLLGFESDSTSSKLQSQLGQKQRWKTFRHCKSSGFSLSPLRCLFYPLFQLSLAFLTPSPYISLSHVLHHAPSYKQGNGFKPQQQDSWCRQTGEGRGGEGRRDLEKALGYWAKTGERTVTFQPSFQTKTDHDVHINVCQEDNLLPKLHPWPLWPQGVSNLTISHFHFWDTEE